MLFLPINRFFFVVVAIVVVITGMSVSNKKCQFSTHGVFTYKTTQSILSICWEMLFYADAFEPVIQVQSYDGYDPHNTKS